MGLTIYFMTTKDTINWHYRALHLIRAIALRKTGILGGPFDTNDISRVNDSQWEKYPEFWQLLHFSDCEGMFVKKFYLTGVDIKDSFYLGDSEKLLAELESLHKWCKEEKYEEIGVEYLEDFYFKLKEEVEDGFGVVIFR